MIRPDAVQPTVDEPEHARLIHNYALSISRLRVNASELRRRSEED